MGKKGWAIALALLLAGKGAGLLPQGREPEGRRLVSALAVDGGREVRLTAVTGARASEQETAEVLTGTGDSLAAACRELRGGSARRVYLGQTEQLLLGQGQELGETLNFVLRDRELRLDTLLYIVKGEAGGALAASAEQVSGETGGRDPRGRTLGELLPRLTEGEHTLAPTLTPGEDGSLRPLGWAVLGKEGVEGYLEGPAALGADLLMGLGVGKVVTLPHGSVELTAVKSWAREGRLSCALTARTVEGAPRAEDLTAWGERVLSAALEHNWDCWGLDRQQELSQPLHWQRWQGCPVKELEIRVTGRLVRH